MAWFRPRRLALVVVGVSLLALAVPACSRTRHHPATQATIPPATGAAGGPVSGLKAPLQGLIYIGSPPPASLMTAVHGFTVEPNWSDLQPARGGPLAANNAIDQAIAAARQLNAQHPGLDYGLRIRVFTGIHAPEWAKNLDGPAFTIQGPQGQPATMTRFWTPAFGSAYQDLQDKLAAKYDAVPEIREVVVDRCAVDTAEPFRLGSNGQANAGAYVRAGYNQAAALACETQQLQESRAWIHTRLDMTLSSNIQVIDSSGTLTQENFTATQNVLNYCRQLLGRQCVLMNTSLRAPQKADATPKKLYQAMKAAGPPLAFQLVVNSGTNQFHTLDNQTLINTLAFAGQLGANSIEPGSKELAQLPMSEVVQYERPLLSDPID
jgi:hypothetical protein